MRILVVSINTASITDTIAQQARAVAAPNTEIVGLTRTLAPSRWRAISKASGGHRCDGPGHGLRPAIRRSDRGRLRRT